MEEIAGAFIFKPGLRDRYKANQWPLANIVISLRIMCKAIESGSTRMRQKDALK